LNESVAGRRRIAVVSVGSGPETATGTLPLPIPQLSAVARRVLLPPDTIILVDIIEVEHVNTAPLLSEATSQSLTNAPSTSSDATPTSHASLV
jgi:hypothetical protein